VLQLDQLPDGVPARVVRVDALDGLAARMRALGLRPGRELAVVRRSRLGGPLQIRIGTTDFIMRPHDAHRVLVETVAQEGTP
jgi:ferrous iron transport protein A